MIQHIIQIGHLALLVPDDRELQRGAGDLVNVLDPAAVRVDGVGGQADEFDAAFREFGLEFCEGAQLGRAHGRVVFRVREEDDPFVADEFVEIDGAVGGVGLEVGGCGAEAETVRERERGLVWVIIMFFGFLGEYLRRK